MPRRLCGEPQGVQRQGSNWFLSHRPHRQSLSYHSPHREPQASAAVWCPERPPLDKTPPLAPATATIAAATSSYEIISTPFGMDIWTMRLRRTGPNMKPASLLRVPGPANMVAISPTSRGAEQACRSGMAAVAWANVFRRLPRTAAPQSRETTCWLDPGGSGRASTDRSRIQAAGVGAAE